MSYPGQRKRFRPCHAAGCLNPVLPRTIDQKRWPRFCAVHAHLSKPKASGPKEEVLTWKDGPIVAYVAENFDVIRDNLKVGWPTIALAMGNLGIRDTRGKYPQANQVSLAFRRIAKQDRLPPEKLRPKERYQNRNGYVTVKVPPGTPGAIKGRMLEHRYVMQLAIGRPLLQMEQVHHRDGTRSHNAIENLELRAGAHGSGIDVPDAVFAAIRTLKLYVRITAKEEANLLRRVHPHLQRKLALVS